MKKVLIVLLCVMGGLILVVVVATWNARFHFEKKVSGEVAGLFQKRAEQGGTLHESDLAALPPPVQRWIRRSGAIGKDRPSSARLRQQGSMRPQGGTSWMNFEAQQYVTFAPPAFIWKADARIVPLVHMAARDMYQDGKGNMFIRLQWLVPIADSRGREIDQGSLIRYLAEITWFPSAAISSYITWEPIDSSSARATMTWGGVTGSGTFHFDSNGDVTGFEAMRYADLSGKFSLELWSVSMKGYSTFGGVRIPSAIEVTWKLKEGDFTWLRLEVTDLDYDNATEY